MLDDADRQHEEHDNNDQAERPQPTPASATEQPQAEIAEAADPTGTVSQIGKLKERLHVAELWMIGLTGAIALFALCSVVVGVLQWSAMKGQLAEMRQGGKDTHHLAAAAKSQAEQMKDLAERMKDQANYTKTIASQAIVQARASEKSSTALIGANRAWMVPETFSQTVAPIHITFRNAGKSPAINVIVKVEYAVLTQNANVWPIVTRGKLSLPEGCGHLKRIRAEALDPLVSAGSPMETELPDLPAEWTTPLPNVRSYKQLLAHGCVWYEDTLTKETRSTEFWMMASNDWFLGDPRPYDPNSADVYSYIYHGKILVFH